jgi:hypothetical protein
MVGGQENYNLLLSLETSTEEQKVSTLIDARIAGNGFLIKREGQSK